MAKFDAQTLGELQEVQELAIRTEKHPESAVVIWVVVAGVDLISRGRLTLGIGAGYFETEYRQYGWEFPARPAVRIRQMEEAVRLILAMWTEKGATFHGRDFHVEDASPAPQTGHKTRPPGV